MLKVHNLHKSYKSGDKYLHVLKGVDLVIAQGEFVSMVGPSGAGKSTLLHLLGGLDKPTKGKVIFGETDLNRINDKKRSLIRNRRFGFVFQFYHLLPEFTVLENVMFPALASSVSTSTKKELKAKARELLQDLGLQERAQHFPNQLSGGEQQRVAIARAIINDPEIIFCDEPTGNLDSETGEHIISILKDLNETKKTTIVVVTHNKELAKVGSRILYLKDGKMVS